MKLRTQTLLFAAWFVVTANAPAPAQTLAPSLRQTPVVYDAASSDQYGLVPAESAFGVGCGDSGGDCDSCRGAAPACGEASNCSCGQSPCRSRRTGCLGIWAGNASGQCGCCGCRASCRGGCASCRGRRASCCGGHTTCRGGCAGGCGQQAGCCGGQAHGRCGQSACCDGCRSARRGNGCLVGTLLDDVKEAVDTAVAGCTPWVEWRTARREGAYFHANTHRGTQANQKEAVAVEDHGAVGGQSRVTTGLGNVEVVPREQWPAEYRDAPVPSPPNLTQSVMDTGPQGGATYRSQVPTLARTTERLVTDGNAADGPAERVTAWAADAEAPDEEDTTVVTDLVP